MKNSQKGIVAPLLITVIALLLVGSGVYFYTQKSPAKNDTITYTKAETADWKTYTDIKYGFEFKYPLNEEVSGPFSDSGRLGTSVSYGVGSPGSQQSETIEIKANTSNQTLQQVFDENYNFYTSDPISTFLISDLKIDGINAKELVTRYGSAGGSVSRFWVINNGYIYFIWADGGGIGKFLSTFKFTK